MLSRALASSHHMNCEFQCNLLPISSNATPFVSGIIKRTKSSWRNIITAKNRNIGAPPNCPAMIGNTLANMAAKIQCVKAPIDWPAARTSLGNISLIKTQITVP